MYNSGEGGFELVRKDPPFHDCGHYHWPHENCPAGSRCPSELCCVFGGTVSGDE
jgi:hypothetical protein